MKRFAVTMALAGVVFTLICGAASAQSESAKQVDKRTLKARTRSITIIDGDDRLVGQIVPELDVDTYVYHPSGNTKTISFITDVDQLDFHVAPGEVIDFSIELAEPLQEKRVCRLQQSLVHPQEVSILWVGEDCR